MNVIILKIFFQHSFLFLNLVFDAKHERIKYVFIFILFVFELLINYQINKNAKRNFLRQKQKHFSIENNAIYTNDKIEKDILKFNHGEIFQNVLFFFPLSGKMCYFSTE